MREPTEMSINSDFHENQYHTSLKFNNKYKIIAYVRVEERLYGRREEE